MYSLYKTESIPQPIQIQLSKKPKVFSQVFAAYLTSTEISEHFKNKYEPNT